MTLFLLMLGSKCLYAQEAILTSGGSASGNGGLASYSVGQIVYTSNIGTTGSVAQGVQQPYEISVTTGIELASKVTLEYKVYPNPTTDFLYLRVENYNYKALWYQLYNVSGELLENKKLTKEETTISMGKLESTIYFLKVTDNKKEVKTFKIIKN